MQLHPQYRWAGQPSTERAFESPEVPLDNAWAYSIDLRLEINPGVWR